MSQIADFDAATPFVAQRHYSQEAVALMRAMRQLRGTNESAESSPQQVLQTVMSLGYQPAADAVLSEADRVREFQQALQQLMSDRKLTYPTCEDVLQVVQALGYRRNQPAETSAEAGIPIDRRRREFDTRLETQERRSSLEPSVQERLDLTEEEHCFLDGLKELRERTERDFASSEELLSLAWRLGYRPVGEDDTVQTWLDEPDRCRVQLQFTAAIEARLKQRAADDFLTCRDLLAVIHQIGFRRS